MWNVCVPSDMRDPNLSVTSLDYITYRNPLFLAVDPLFYPRETLVLVLRQLLIGHKFIYEELDSHYLSHQWAVCPLHTHHENHGPKDIGADDLSGREMPQGKKSREGSEARSLAGDSALLSLYLPLLLWLSLSFRGSGRKNGQHI